MHLFSFRKLFCDLFLLLFCVCVFFEADRTPKWKENGDMNAGGLNAGGQISLSCCKEIIKLTN